MNIRSDRRLRLAALLGVSAATLAFAAGAQAQNTTPQSGAPSAGTVEEVVVSASRITTAGFDAPTPTTVLGIEMIQKAAEPNIFNAITQLPSLQGSTGTTVNNGNTSTGQTGLSALNMRGLNPTQGTRTLTLIDGQRVVPSNVNGVTDVSQFPQMLVQRVDVVTGGASASYGSDAVAGVVNFVTDTRFVGFKANIQGSITTYGDDEKENIQFAYGTRFLNDRLHVTVSGEYLNSEGAAGALLGQVPLHGRPKPDLSGNTSYAITTTPAGQPQFTYFTGVYAQPINTGRNGLIINGPLQGIAWDDNGKSYTFQYGGSGIPTKANSTSVVGCPGTTCQGGEQSNAAGGSSIDAVLRRKVAYGRVSYEVNDNLEVFATLNLANVFTITAPTRGAPMTPLVAQCDNAFLDATVKAACAAANVTQFNFGTRAQNLNRDTHVNNTRQQQRLVFGANGKFNLGDQEWSYDAYFQHGVSLTDIHITDILLRARYNAAIDAVNLNGSVVCRSAVARAQGCLPFNPFGGVANSEASFVWFAPANGPRSHSFQRQEAAALTFNGVPFSIPAGDVAIAAGVEWREEAYKTYGDPYGAGNAFTPNNAMYPNDPILAANGDNWFAGNYHNGRGRYDVREGFIEAGVPLWNNDSLGKADLNVAGRITNYSTSGTVKTWKVGGTWDTPIEGLRIRGVKSRDIRAPNLQDLFAASINMNNGVTNRATGQNVTILNKEVGNPNLTPEISDNNEIGAVYRPSFAPGFSISLDYFNILVDDAIGALTNQQIVDACFNGNTALCPNVFLGGTPGSNNPSYVIVQSFNIASLETDGFDLEASYRFQPQDWNLPIPGSVTMRGLFTKTFHYTVDPGIQGVQVDERAGQNNGTIPNWKAYFQQTYALGPWQFTATERMHSDGVINNKYLVCQSNCPVPTVDRPTSNFNEIPGATFLDLGASYKLNDQIEFYGKTDNVTNEQPPPFGGGLYDNIGRRYSLGVRLRY